MPFPTIAQASTALLFLISLTIGGCSQTVSPVPSENSNTSSNATTQPSPQPSSQPSTESNASAPDRDNDASTPPTIVEGKPKPIQANPLKAKTESDPTKEEAKSQKPIANRSLLFSCTTNEGKEILLFETDETIDYSFGAPGTRPELELQVPRDRASTWQWKGIGRDMSYSVEVPNGDTSYGVFWSVDRLSETKAVEAGVRVQRDRKTLATVYCAEKIVSNLQGVKLKPIEY